MAAPAGHGWMGGRNGSTRISSYYSQISSQAEVVDIENTYRPASLNPSNGSFNFADIGTDLDYLSAQGGTKKLIINIPHKKFVAIANAASWVPSWWGARDVAWSAASNGSAVLMRLDNSTIRGYWIALFAALETYLDAHAHGDLVSIIRVGSESALSNPYDVNGNPISIGASTWQTSLEAVMSGVRAANAYPLMAYTNGFSIVSQTGYIETLLGYGIDAIGNSDTEPFKQNDLGNHNRMLTMAQYAADAILMHNVEDGNYNITCVPPADYLNPTYASTTLTKTTAGSAMMKFFVDAHVSYYKTAKLCWLNSQYGTAGSDSTTVGANIMTAMTAYGSGGLNTFPVDSSGGEPPVDPPVSSTSFTLKSVQATIPASGTPPVALPVAHSLPATPKFILTIMNKATANETNTASGSIGIGASDFTHEWLVALRANAANPTTTKTYAVTDHSGGLTLSGSNNLDYSFNDGTPDATNINLSVDNVGASAYLVNIVTGTGDGLKRFVGTAALSTEDTAVPITATDPDTGATFAPNLAIVDAINTTFGAGFVDHALMSYGIACIDNAAATVQKCIIFKNENGVSPSEPALKLHTTRVGGIINTSDAEAFTVDLAFTATGCTVTAKGGDGTGASVGVKLLRLEDADMDLVDITFPTAIGDADHAIGGYLDFGMMVGTTLDTADSIDTTNAASFFISTFTPTVALANANSYEDAQTTADDRARTAQKPVYLLTQDGSVAMVGDYSGQDGTNLTINYTTAPGTAYKGFLLRVYKPTVLDATNTSVTVPTTIDLSSYTDYARLGIGSATSIEIKADGGSQITVTWNNDPDGLFTGGSTNYPQFSATNSAPSGALAASAARSYWGTLGDIVAITAPAGIETSNILAWINASGVDIDITVSISDGSVSDFTDTISSADTTTGNIERALIEADYVASQNGETITITAEISAVNAVGGNMSVQAVALTNNYTPPVDITPPTLVFGYPQLVSMTETSPGSGLYDVMISVQLSEAGEVFAQARLATNTADPTSQQVEAGTDGADSGADIVAETANTDIDFLETVQLTLEDLDEGTEYFIDVGAKDNAATPNYMVGAYSLQITTPSSGGGGGEGSYSVTVQLDNGAGSLSVDTNVEYIWVDADDFGSGQTISGTWTPAVSGSTGLLTVQRSATDPGRLLVRGENGEFYRSTELTPE